MSDLFLDSLITLLLVISVGFGGIGVIGLLLFPDLRSRMFTATRAATISISTITLAVIVYALYTFQSSGGDQYIILVLHSVFLLCIVTGANIVQYTTIISRRRSMTPCPKLSNPPAVEK